MYSRLLLIICCGVCCSGVGGCRSPNSASSAAGGRPFDFASVPAQSEPEIKTAGATKKTGTQGPAKDTVQPANASEPDTQEADTATNDRSLLTKWFPPRAKGGKPKRMPLPLSDEKKANAGDEWDF